MIQVTKLSENGFLESMYGLGLSYGLTSNIRYTHLRVNGELIDKLKAVSLKLYNKDNGENKFLRSMVVWLMVRAPRYWWQEADTYMVASPPKQSESTMHTIHRGLKMEDFEDGSISIDGLRELNGIINAKPNIEHIKKHLPEGFLQRRTWMVNYQTLRTIFKQRKNHRLPHWKEFVASVMEQVNHPEYLEDILK